MTRRQQRFVSEYLVDLNATKAAERAGYSAKTAGAAGARLLKDVRISAAINEAIDARAGKVGLTAEWVIERLCENVRRAMTLVPVTDKEGKPTGSFVYEGAVANKALELLGKHLGLFPDKLIANFEDPTKLSDAELERRRAEVNSRRSALALVG